MAYITEFKATISEKIGIDGIGLGLISYVNNGNLKTGETVFVNGKKCKVIKLMENGKECDAVSAGMNAVVVLEGLLYESANPGDFIFSDNRQSEENNSENEQQELISPYEGDGKYIFISYAHKDYKAVFPIIKRIQEEGYAVWYDEGIDPGNEWDEAIAEHIEKSALMLAFISENYINSDNCKDELKFARDEGVSRILIYLENTELPSGMKMRLGRQQAIHCYGYEDKEAFYGKLFGASEIEKLPKEFIHKNSNDAISKAISASAGIYMSFVAKDAKWANLFKEVLVNDKKRVLMASESIRGNIGELERTVKSSSAVLFVLSKDVLTDLRVIKELSFAAEAKKPIIPVFVEDFELTAAFNYYLKDIAHINAYSFKGRSLKVVVDAVNGILG